MFLQSLNQIYSIDFVVIHLYKNMFEDYKEVDIRTLLWLAVRTSP